MRLVHINSYYETNALHRELVGALDALGSIEQVVFVPLIRTRDDPVFREERWGQVVVHYSFCFNRYDRFFWPYKIYKSWRAFRAFLVGLEPDVVHAHTVISNGLLAYFLATVKKIPFVVTVRGTDTEFFFKKSKFFVWVGAKVLRLAKCVILLSPGYRDRQLAYYFKRRRSLGVMEKVRVIPNAISADWHHANVSFPRIVRRRIIFVGRLDKNKNLRLVIEAVRKMTASGESLTLDVVGDGPELARLIELANGLPVRFLGRIEEQSKLAEAIGCADMLVMPSFSETFGLVYVEAMSLGLPVIYTRGQGFDGFFAEGEVGFSVDPFSTETRKQLVQ